jgi:O-phospho-L-seryl-tRNASec:L-selenocysteinyl-tRNA synthase
MDSERLESLSGFISSTYLHQAVGSRSAVGNKFSELLSQRRIPDVGWSESEIELFIREISLWDSNNFPEKAAVGEREGRCFSRVVERRHWAFTHGIGRSGDVNAEQPKAAGSSFLLNLTKVLVRDALKNLCGISLVPKEVVVLPVATGMGLMLGMSAVSQTHLDDFRRNVIWSRIDQKSCIKSMTFNPSLRIHCVEQKREGEGLSTDLEAIASRIDSLGPSTIHSIVLTTSTFSPRTPDDVPAMARLCKEKNIPLIVNNAYGLQCTKCCHLINEALRVGRVDLVVQSMDKNFGVPVGGSILFGPLSDKVNSIYPGRASLSPILDLLITFLELGRNRIKKLLTERKQMFDYMLAELAKIDHVRVLNIPGNKISIAVVSDIPGLLDEQIGSELFLRNVSGSRVFVRSDKAKQIDDNFPLLMNFGCHSTEPVANQYMNVACAIGSSKKDVDVFISRLSSLLNKRLKTLSVS